MKLNKYILALFLFFYTLKFALCNPFNIRTYDQKNYYDKNGIWYLTEYKEDFRETISNMFKQSYSYFDFIKNTLSNIKPSYREISKQKYYINLLGQKQGWISPTFYIKYKLQDNRKKADFKLIELNRQMFEKNSFNKLNLNINTFSVTSNITQKYDFKCIYWKNKIKNKFTDMCFTQYISNWGGGEVILNSYTLIDLNSNNKPKKFDYQNGDLIKISGETTYINNETIDIDHYSVKLKPKNTKLIERNVAKFINNSPSKYNRYITKNKDMKFVMQHKHNIKGKLRVVYTSEWENTKINVLIKY